MSGETKENEGSAAAAAAESKNLTYPYLGSLTKEKGELIFTRRKGYNHMPSPEQPIFVLLIGTPGSGKSTALARMNELVGLDPENAVQISLDSLIESLEPFRAKTSEIATKMLAASGLELRNNLPEEVVGEIAGKTSGPYLSYMKAKKNNRPGKVGNPLEMSLNEMRYYLLDKALAEGKNIIYERTISDASKDSLKEEVFARIAASGKPYKIFVVYTKIDDETELRDRLRRRPIGMMKRDPSFFRGVPSVMARKFIANHEEYFRKYLLPLESEGVQLVVLYWDGRDPQYIPERPAAAATENAPKETANAKGGKRKTRRRKTRKNKRKNRKTRCS
jgi:energy-coupling factor transporter ATP-binding protein EcfA2